MDPKEFIPTEPKPLPDEETRARELWRRAIWPKNELNDWDLSINPCAEIPASLTQATYNELHKKFERNIKDFGNVSDPAFNLTDSMILTMGLVREHSHIFQLDRVMGGPCARIFDTNVQSLSRMFKTDYTDDLERHLKLEKGNAWLAELYGLMLKEIGHELELEAAMVYQQHKWLICPFIPIIIQKHLDPSTYVMHYRFLTRYGYIPESAKAKWAKSYGRNAI